MRLPAWAAVFFVFYALLISVAQGSTRKRVNFSPNYMSSDDIIRYFKSFSAKTSSFNKLNEAFYTDEFSEDLFHKIDNLMGVPQFNKWLMKTKEITDKSDMKGRSLLSSYQSTLNAPCNPLTVFNSTIPQVIRRWEGDQTLVSNELDEWQLKNFRVPPSEICNRFKGLTCQYKRSLDPDLDQGKSVELTNDTFCQCAEDPMNVGYYKSSLRKKEYSEVSYPDGCYVRPWRPCMFLSVDPAFKNLYYDWHKDLENERRVLAQMVFPVGRAHRCKEDTFCLDMIPGMMRPICWCTPNSMDKQCNKTAKFKVPLGTELMKIRKNFIQHIINANDTKSMCNPEYNAKVTMLARAVGKNPTRSGVMDIMEQLGNPTSRIRICDFRSDLMCDEISRTCKGSLNCDQGKIHVGKGVCAANNGFPCQTNEECVQNAKCQHFNGLAESACVCHKGYGDKCELLNSAFFGSRFLPVISGFKEQTFLKLQTEIHAALESWEDTMSLNEGDFCDPASDKNALDLVNWFGSLEEYDQDKGSIMLKMAHHITKEISKSCRYTNFLRCDVISSRCVPIHGRKLLSISTDVLGGIKIVAEVEPKKECIVEMPKVFNSIVDFVCPRGYYCKKSRAGGHCLPDCDSVFAPPKECPQSHTTPSLLVNENPDPDAQVSPREVPDEEETTESAITDLEDKDDDSLKNSLVNPGNEVSNEISEPDVDKTDVPSVTDDDDDTDTDGGGQNEIGSKNDIDDDRKSVIEPEDNQDDLEGRAAPPCLKANEYIDKGPPEDCIPCPNGQIANSAKTDCIDCPSGQEYDPMLDGCGCKPNHVPDTTMPGTCKPCPTDQTANPNLPKVCVCDDATKIPDPAKPEDCIPCKDGNIRDPDQPDMCKCKPNHIPDPTKPGTCKACGDFQMPDTSVIPAVDCTCVVNAVPDGTDKCKCDSGYVPDSTGTMCEPGPAPGPAPSCGPEQETGMTPGTCVCKDKEKILDPTKPEECICDTTDKETNPKDPNKCKCKDDKKVPNTATFVCEECPIDRMQDPNDVYKCICESGKVPAPPPDDKDKCVSSSCPPNQKPHPTDSSKCVCTSPTQHIDPSDSTVCKDCGVDQIADPMNPTMCTCANDAIPDAVDKNKCNKCPPDKVANDDKTKCVCMLGSIEETGGTCKECDKTIGLVPNSNQTECVCPPGHIPSGTVGAKPPDKCEFCSMPGQYADLTSTPPVCKQCEFGKVPDGNHSICEPCPAGQVPDKGDLNSCKACDPTDVPDPANLGECKKCEGDLKPNADQTNCECMAGMVPDTSNPTSCIPGTTTASPSTTSPPKRELNLGDACVKECRRNQGKDGIECKNGICSCVRGTRPDKPKHGKRVVCRVPLDHQCHPNNSSGKKPASERIGCVTGSECVPVNGRTYCRQIKEKGYIVISQDEYKKRPKSGASSLDSKLGWKQLGALVITITLTVPYIDAFPR